MRVDLNSDIGESFGRYTLGMDERIIPLVSSVNAACGFHAADPCVMEKTVERAAVAGAAVGAHPGFPDLMGFGRRNMQLSPAEAKAYVLYQLGALDAFLRVRGQRMQHVKPHGALYNMAAKDPVLARAICEAVLAFDRELIVLALFGGALYQTAKELGLRTASEVFADRAYEADGTLVPRSKPGAMLTDETLAIARVVRMVTEGRLTAVDGQDIPIRADSICVHGDGEKALLFVERIRAALERKGVEICPLREMAL
ncbi:LamB/YcsF family protein [Oribacterium sp. oral taxon 102]|uniref:LamB/YcsF family protein n=1 Tax=Oribacterium sp. oral taxon 102 TaxID=671214 RepID=UPI0015BC66E8|nr:5-oxoprolinase subunit PxpA [Oribacterium sp. oral taxon 102]NWO21978.1 LamB/YcsF family protein [Oribacterium sp. oral taxon 102]